MFKDMNTSFLFRNEVFFFILLPMEILFLLLIMVVAFLYASVGHGGASGYLALMAIFSIEPSLMRASALVLNLFVSTIAFVAFYKGGHFKWKILLPFVITSIPMSFLGAQIELNPAIYKFILAIFLLFAVARMLFIKVKSSDEQRPLPFTTGLMIGALLGFLSGLIGIGGGIVLSPVLLLFKWANMKETAAVSALFIFLNSASGLLGLSLGGLKFTGELNLLLFMAVTGAMAGAFAGSFKMQQVSLKYILAGVLMVASIKLFLV
jgi:uncharacterized protein